VTETLPFVSVVVPVLNGEDTLADSLATLLRVDYPPERREVIIVDNGSTDRTPEILDRAPVRRLFEPRRGTAKARNLGIEASRGEIVAFTDADCLVTKGWLRALVAGFDGDEVGGVAGEILPFPPRTAAERHAARTRHLSPRRYLHRPELPFAVTANLAFRREVFDQVGLLDPEAPRGGECTDFCTRFFRGIGQRIVFAPRATVFHRHRSNTWELFRQQWNYGRGHAYLYEKYAAELPWTWRHRRQAWGDLARTAGALGTTGLRRATGRASRDDLEFHYFELVRKLASRLGFAWHRLGQRPAAAPMTGDDGPRR
jgi:glycosyltransferase involved in cell wall biosynthesis